MSTTSVIKRAYEHVFSSLASSKCEYRFFSYREDFAQLWELDDDCLDLASDKPIELIVVWDGIPPKAVANGVDTAAHLSALDWVVAFSLKRYDEYRRSHKSNPETAVCPNVRITIVDEFSGNIGNSKAVQFFDQIPKRDWLTLPWLSIYQPRGDLRRTQTTTDFLDRTGFLPIGGSSPNVHDCVSFSEAMIDSQFDASQMEIVRRTWSAMLLSPNESDDHHALANAIGPFAFLGAQDCLHEKALVQLLCWLGYEIQGSKTSKGSTPVIWDRSKSKRRLRNCYKLYNKLNILFVDDCAFSNRWAEVLQGFLGMEASTKDSTFAGTRSVGRVIENKKAKKPSIYLHAIDNVNDLIESLRIAIDEQAGNSDAAPVIRINHKQIAFGDKEKNEFVDMLVLDLRLQQGNNLGQEVNFFRQVHSIASLCQNAINGFRISKQALSVVEAWLDDAENKDKSVARTDEGYIKSLTLFARLLASLDESLPIVLFSSTSRGDILRILEDHPNILLQWSKPKVDSQHFHANVRKSVAQFHAVFEEALKLVPARLLARRLTVDRQTDFDKLQETDCTSVGTNESPWTIELMLDEVGLAEEKIIQDEEQQKHLRLGGFLFISPPGRSMSAIETGLRSKETEAKQNEKPGLFGKYQLRKYKNLKPLLEYVLKEAKSNDVLTFPISCGGDFASSPNAFKKKSDLTNDESVADNLFLELFKTIVEIAIYGVARQIIPNNSVVNFDVRGATRIGYVGSFVVSYLKSVGVVNADEKEGDVLRSLDGTPEYRQHRSEIISTFRQKWGLRIKEKITRELIVTPQTDGDLDATVHPCDDASDPPAIDDAARGRPDRFDFEDDKIYFFAKDSPRFLVQDVRKQYAADDNYRPKANVIRAFGLNFSNSPTLRLHLLADALIHEWLWDGIVKSKVFKNSSLLKGWVEEKSLADCYDSTLDCLLQANRHLSQGRRAEAIANLMMLSNINISADRRGIGMILLGLQRAVHCLTGADYQRLAELIDSFQHSDDSQRLKGIVQKNDGNWIIVSGSVEYATNPNSLHSTLSEGDKVTFLTERHVGGLIAKDVRATLSHK